MWEALAGVGLGALKGVEDQKKEDRDRRLQAITAQYSPWTGMHPQPVQSSSMIGSIGQGGLAGAQFGQGQAAADQQGQFNKAYIDMLNRKGQAAGPYDPKNDTVG